MITPTVWAAYLCLLCVVGADVILFHRPIAAYIGRYQRPGRHRPRPIMPHVHTASLFFNGVAYCDCGEWTRLPEDARSDTTN